jgi:hypothetical protein
MTFNESQITFIHPKIFKTFDNGRNENKSKNPI